MNRTVSLSSTRTLLSVLALSGFACAGRAPSNLPPMTTSVPVAMPTPERRPDTPPPPAVQRTDLEPGGSGFDVLDGIFPAALGFSLNVEDADLREVVSILSERASGRIVLDPDIDMRVTASFDGVSLTDAVKTLLGRLELGTRVKGGIVRIGHPVPATTVFHLSLPDALLSSEPKETAGLQSWAAVQQAVEMTLSSEGQAHVDPEGSLLMVRDFPSRIDLIETVLQETVAPRRRQVTIEAMILEVELDDSTEYGIDWSAPDLSFAVGGERVTGGFGSTLAPSTSTTSFSLSTSNLSMMLTALKNRGQLNVLSAPRVTTLNRVPATMSITEEIPYYTSELASIGNDAVQSIDLNFRQAGVKLEVTPVISSGGDVMLRVHPEITELTGFTPSLEGLPPNPILDKREITTMMRAQDGESVVLAGLIRRRYSETSAEVPGLGRIKGLGSLFRNVSQNSTRSELVIIVTPVVADTEFHALAVEKSIERAEELRRKFQIGPITKAIKDEASYQPGVSSAAD